ncbi:MAG: hypothetical protein WHS77_09560 [Brevinematales bacterium]
MKYEFHKYLFILLILINSLSALENRELPLDLPRTPISSVYGYCLPSFNTENPYFLFNSYGFNGIIQNIFVTGPNLNLGYGYNYQNIKNTVFSSNFVDYDYQWQSKDFLNIYGIYSFLYFFKINAELSYQKNRLINQNEIYENYNYDKYSFNISLAYDRRFSSLQQWTLGQIFIYPEEGFFINSGSSHNIITSGGTRFDITSLFLKSQFLFHPTKQIVFSLNLNAESLLKANKYWAFSPVANVIGSYDWPCDYYIQGNIEMRTLIPKGIFWDSPAFWYFNSYSFKFSGGFIVGYNATYGGYLINDESIYMHSFYVAPMIAIRMNGILLTVLRFDIAIAGSKNYNYILSFNIGTIDNTPVSVWKKGY